MKFLCNLIFAILLVALGVLAGLAWLKSTERHAPIPVKQEGKLSVVYLKNKEGPDMYLMTYENHRYLCNGSDIVLIPDSLEQ